MKNRSLYLISLVALLFNSMFGQEGTNSEKDILEVKSHFNRLYGSDFNLLNGRQYYLLYSSISHPFLYSDQYNSENLWLDGVQYDAIPINYDIYKQQLILQYRSYSGEPKQLILNEEFIDGFTLNNKEFRRLSFHETGSGFFQVVTSGELAYYFAWEKTMFYSPTSNSTPYNYTQASRKAYLFKSGQLYPIKSTSSFIKVFEKRYRKDIGRFIRKEKINFRSSTAESINRLIAYCKELTETSW